MRFYFRFIKTPQEKIRKKFLKTGQLTGKGKSSLIREAKKNTKMNG
ncbi:hypothetical protein [Elizabethkingia ursingii]|nr:hypothetical protein [Elizabethkingia ursingii]